MLVKLFLLFTLVPLLELYLLIRLGTVVGAFDTLAIVIGTGIVGSLLAKSQGLVILNRIRSEFNEGRIPAESLFDGLLILISGILLITPGLLTDALGLSFLLPQARQLFKWWLKRKIEEKMSEGSLQVHSNFETSGSDRNLHRLDR